MGATIKFDGSQDRIVMQRGGLSVFAATAATDAAPRAHMDPQRRLTVSTRDWIGAECLTGNPRPVASDLQSSVETIQQL